MNRKQEEHVCLEAVSIAQHNKTVPEKVGGKWVVNVLIIKIPNKDKENRPNLTENFHTKIIPVYHQTYHFIQFSYQWQFIRFYKKGQTLKPQYCDLFVNSNLIVFICSLYHVQLYFSLGSFLNFYPCPR